MSSISSKKKIRPSASCIEALSSLSEDKNNPYSMLMQIIKQNSPECIVRTPYKIKRTPQITETKWIKLSNKRMHQIKESPSRQILNLYPKLPVLRTKLQIGHKKISDLSGKKAKILQKIYKINKYNIQILKSLKEAQQIKKLGQKHRQEINQIRQIIQQIHNQRQNKQKQAIRLEANIQALQHKFNLCQVNANNLQQRKGNIVYAVQAQVKRNNLIKNKLQEMLSKFQKNNLIPKLANQLFTTLILFYQIKNCQQLNKKQNITNGNRRSHLVSQNSQKKIKKQNLLQKQQPIVRNQLKLCHRQDRKQLLTKLPFALVAICSIYMYIKLKDIDKKYFNKISYFSQKTKQIFDFQRFKSIVEDYFAERKARKLKCVQHNDNQPTNLVKQQPEKQQLLIRDSQQRKNQQTNCNNDKFAVEQTHFLIKEQNQPTHKQLSMKLTISNSCQCGHELSNAISQQNMQELLKKYLNTRIHSIEQTEQCCMIQDQIEQVDNIQQQIN